jgi:hypothetical protein
MVCYEVGAQTRRGAFPQSMESCGRTGVSMVNSSTARLAAREFYSVTRSNSLAQGCGGDPLALVDLARKRIGRKIMTRGLALLSAAFGQRLGCLTSTQQFEFKSLLEMLRYPSQLPRRAPLSRSPRDRSSSLTPDPHTGLSGPAVCLEARLYQVSADGHPAPRSPTITAYAVPAAVGIVADVEEAGGNRSK